MADSKKTSYSFSAPVFSAPMRKSINVSGFQTASQRAETPKIGPEIGPDPRNATALVHLPPKPTIDLGHGILLDFCHGFRLTAPKGSRLHVRGIDLDSGVVLEEYYFNGEGMLTSNRKYYIPWRIEIFDDKETLIASHDYDCRGKDVTIVIPDGGLGDNLAWLPYSEEFRKARNCKLTCVCGEWLIRIVAKNYPEINFIPVGTEPDLTGYGCYFCAIFPKERKNWRPSDHQNFGMQGSVAKLLGLPPEPCQVKLTLDAPRPFPEPFVCISAMATNPAKHWNYPDGWNTVIRELKQRGYRVLVIDRDHTLQYGPMKISVPSEAEDFTGRKPLTERIALLQHAAFFIGLPSGLSWLAWNCKIPCVMISGFTLDGSEFPTPYRVTNFHFCHGCWNDSNLFFDMKVPIWCPRHLGTPREIECTKVITPRMVLEVIDRIPGVLPHKD